MDIGSFYFINDQYFIDFPEPTLSKNHETIHGQPHKRPCFYVFSNSTNNISWMVPISSQLKKYTNLYNNKMAKFGKCDTLAFGDVLGYRKAFLIQNMCPVTLSYIDSQYFDSNSGIPIRVSGVLEQDIIKKANRVLALVRIGKNLVFPDILTIEKKLIS